MRGAPGGGRFRPGNPGRPKGARNKATLTIEALLDGESEAITRKAIEMALGGDTTAMRLVIIASVHLGATGPYRLHSRSWRQQLMP